jgi:2-dehydropantoate 2-reductase
VPFGEPDGRITERTQEVARILASAVGYNADIRTDMGSWLMTHVALLFPSIGPALYACGADNYRLARTRDGVLLATRAARKGFQVLRALGVPITPAGFQRLEWLPEPALVAFMQHAFARESMEIALAKHANAARDEAKHLADEFLAAARNTSVPTHAIDSLYPHFDSDTPLLPDGSAKIPMKWGGLVAVSGALIAAIAGVATAVNRVKRERSV